MKSGLNGLVATYVVQIGSDKLRGFSSELVTDLPRQAWVISCLRLYPRRSTDRLRQQVLRSEKLQLLYWLQCFDMKKILLLVALGLSGSILGVGYFYWQRATALPEWLADEPTTNTSPINSPISGTISPSPTTRPATAIQEKLQAAQPGKVQEQLTGAEVDNLIVAGLNKSNSGTLPKAIKKIKTQIKQDEIRTGAVIDLAEVESMPAGSRQEMLKKLLKVIPQLKGQSVYVGLVGKLSVQNGQPQLSADSKLQLGQVELPIDEVAQKLGVTREELAQTVTNYLQFRDLRLENIQLTDQGAVITGQKGELNKPKKVN